MTRHFGLSPKSQYGDVKITKVVYQRNNTDITPPLPKPLRVRRVVGLALLSVALLGGVWIVAEGIL